MLFEKLKRFFFLKSSNEQVGQELVAIANDTNPIASASPVNTNAASTQQSNAQEFKFPVVVAADNPWGVDVVDIRSFTQSMLSTSKDENCAVNALSFGLDDGLGFVGQAPQSVRSMMSSLAYRIDARLDDGILFTPRKMEEKWAIFFHQQKIICVRSWTRRVNLIAHTEQENGTLYIKRIEGGFGEGEADDDHTERMFDFLIRSHILAEPYPTPLPQELNDDPMTAALWCFSAFGDRAICSTKGIVSPRLSDKPMRSDTLLHIAAARSDMEAVARHSKVIPFDAIARDGFAPLHWALASRDPSAVQKMIELGSKVDVRSLEGATPLMNAVQSQLLDFAKMFLTQGADVNARDSRGFTSLHRAAEMGHDDIAQLLLEHGANPDADAEGHTPRSLAASRDRVAILKMMTLSS